MYDCVQGFALGTLQWLLSPIQRYVLKVDWHKLSVVYSRADAAAQKIDHAVIGGVVAVVVFAMLCLLIVLGRYFARHKGTYFTHEAKGADDAADADTAIINAEGGQTNTDDKKEYYI
ncbi:hypothetical protein QTP86_014480 [Hemibagrus guttatus]|nr:hypothetical protein QTP86_014480 [Hemibagrus guttatus]